MYLMGQERKCLQRYKIFITLFSCFPMIRELNYLVSRAGRMTDIAVSLYQVLYSWWFCGVSRTNKPLVLPLCVEVELSHGLTQTVSSLQPFLSSIPTLSLLDSQRNLTSLRPLSLVQVSLEVIKRVIRNGDRHAGTQTVWCHQSASEQTKMGLDPQLLCAGFVAGPVVKGIWICEVSVPR